MSDDDDDYMMLSGEERALIHAYRAQRKVAYATLERQLCDAEMFTSTRNHIADAYDSYDNPREQWDD